MRPIILAGLLLSLVTPFTPFGQSAAPPQPGSIWREPITGMEFVWVPGGSFEMGCGSWDRDCQDSEKPAHQVTLYGFWMGKTEVTQGQWKRIMGGNPSRFKNGDTYPVEQVTWDDAQHFIAKLNRQSKGVRFRLPREAEWEYACRAGGKKQVYGTQSGDLSSATANTSEASKNTTTPVASYPPNGLGLFDMTGNVWEWVQDAYVAYSGGPATDPVVDYGAKRVGRGGGWNSVALDARCSLRSYGAPSSKYGHLGFRLARNGGVASATPATASDDGAFGLKFGVKPDQSIMAGTSTLTDENGRTLYEVQPPLPVNELKQYYVSVTPISTVIDAIIGMKFTFECADEVSKLSKIIEAKYKGVAVVLQRNATKVSFQTEKTRISISCVTRIGLPVVKLVYASLPLLEVVDREQEIVKRQEREQKEEEIESSSTQKGY